MRLGWVAMRLCRDVNLRPVVSCGEGGREGGGRRMEEGREGWDEQFV